MESVTCPHCGSHEDFSVVYAGGSVLQFQQAGIDEENNAIYSGRLVKGRPITKLDRYERAWCGQCGETIPPYLIGMNRYVRLACAAVD